jgi:hypothetical protein
MPVMRPSSGYGSSSSQPHGGVADEQHGLGPASQGNSSEPRSEQHQQQHGLGHSQQDGAGAEQQEGGGVDFITHALHELLIKDTQAFWASTVAPSTAQVAQVHVCVRMVRGLMVAHEGAQTRHPLGRQTPTAPRCGSPCC